jgi:hypothetical protein
MITATTNILKKIIIGNVAFYSRRVVKRRNIILHLLRNFYFYFRGWKIAESARSPLWQRYGEQKWRWPVNSKMHSFLLGLATNTTKNAGSTHTDIQILRILIYMMYKSGQKGWSGIYTGPPRREKYGNGIGPNLESVAGNVAAIHDPPPTRVQ